MTTEISNSIIYSLTLKSKYLMVSNGLTHYFCSVDYLNNDYFFLTEIPKFKNS